MTEEDAGVQRFIDQVDAFNAHDLEAFLACYADDTVIVSTSGAAIVGKDNLRKSYAARFEDATLHCDIDRVENRGGGWLEAWERVSSASGERQVRALFEILDGRISRAALFSS